MGRLILTPSTHPTLLNIATGFGTTWYRRFVACCLILVCFVETIRMVTARARVSFLLGRGRFPKWARAWGGVGNLIVQHHNYTLPLDDPRARFPFFHPRRKGWPMPRTRMNERTREQRREKRRQAELEAEIRKANDALWRRLFGRHKCKD